MTRDTGRLRPGDTCVFLGIVEVFLELEGHLFTPLTILCFGSQQLVGVLVPAEEERG